MPKPLTFVQADIMLAKSHHLPFLDELKEIMDNELHLVVLGAAIRDKTASDISCESPALAKILVGCKRIVPDRSQKFDIVFENYLLGLWTLLTTCEHDLIYGEPPLVL